MSDEIGLTLVSNHVREIFVECSFFGLEIGFRLGTSWALQTVSSHHLVAPENLRQTDIVSKVLPFRDSGVVSLGPHGDVVGYSLRISVVVFDSVLNTFESVAIFQQFIHFLLETKFKSGQLVLGEMLVRYEFFKFSYNYGMNSDLCLPSGVANGSNWL